MNDERKQKRILLRTPALFLCLSAFLLVSGTFLQTVEIPVRITSDPYAAEQYDLMHAFFPLSFGFWILAIIFLGYSLFLWRKKPLDITQLHKQSSIKSSVAVMALGVLALISTFLTWVIVKAVTSGQSFALSGVGLIRSNYWAGDVIYLVFVSPLIAILYIPLLSLVEKQKINVERAFLLLLSSIFIFSAIVSVLSTDSWSYSISFMGGAGGGTATFESPGIGLLLAAFSAAGLLAVAITDVIYLYNLRNAGSHDIR